MIAAHNAQNALFNLAVVIINAAKAPTPDFTSSTTKASVGDTISLSDMSQYCSNFTDWEITPANYIFANETDRDDENINVVFDADFINDPNSSPKHSVCKICVTYCLFLPCT